MKTSEFIWANESTIRTLLSIGNRIAMGNEKFDKSFIEHYSSATAIIMAAILDKHVDMDEAIVFFNSVKYLQLRLEE